MRTPARPLTAAVAAVLGAGLIGLSLQPAPAAEPVSRAVTGVTVRMLPQLAHAGPTPDKPKKALAALEVQVEPAEPAVALRLQVHTAQGWRTVGTGQTDAGGQAVLEAEATLDGKPATYRVKAGEVRSAPTDAAVWLKPTFTDTFAGKRLSKVWKNRVTGYNPKGLRACSRGSAKAVTVAEGVVRLSVLKDPARDDLCTVQHSDGVTRQHAYRLNGNISTEGAFSYRYGFAAARIKFPRLRGQHGGFWLQPLPKVPGKWGPTWTGAEVDIIESFGAAAEGGGLASFTYHWAKAHVRVKTGGPLANQRSYLANRKDAWHRNFHVFSLEWSPTVYIFRIDGQETWRSYEGISGIGEFPILSLLSSDYELPRLADSKLPQHMYVDWVRVWQDPTGANLAH